MGRPVGTHQTGAVDREAHRQVLDAHVVHHLVIGALEEGGVNRREGPHPFGRHPGGEGHRVLFGDPDIEAARGMRLGELVDTGAGRHRGRDRADARVIIGELGERLAEHVLIGRRAGRALGLFAGDDVELGHAVILVGGVFGRRVALALLGHDMDQHRAFRGVAHVFEHGQQVIEVVAVDRADIVEAQFLEQRAAGHHAAGEFLGLADGVVQAAAHLLDRAARKAADAEIFGRRDHPREIGRQPPHRRGDRHVVVVEDHDQAVARLGRVVHRLVGHPGAHRAVADHGNPAAGAVLELVGHGKAERRRDRGRGMRRAEGVVFALGALGEARQPSALTQGADAVAPAGNDLVRIALVPHVPHQLVLGRVEHIVDGDGQFDHAQPRTKVPARGADRVDHLGAEFVGKLAKLFGLEAAQIVRGVNLIEQRRVRRLIHPASFTHCKPACR